MSSDKVMYHISNDGIPRKCNAKVVCRVGGANAEDPRYNAHFETYEAAQNYADIRNEKESLPSVRKLKTSSQEDTLKNKDSFTNKLIKQIGSKANGLSSEVYLMTAYAETYNMNNAIVINKDGSTSIIGRKTDVVSEETIKNLTQKAFDTVTFEYGIPDPEKHIKSIYFKDNDSSQMVLHLGSSNMLDGAYVNSDGYKMMELKKGHSGGAQISEVTLGMDSDGNFDIPEGSMNELVKEAIENKNYKISSKGNQYDLKVDEYASMWQFVEAYKKKGASELLITDKIGKATYIDLDRDVDKVVDELIKEDYVVNLKIRMNQTIRSINNDQRRDFIREGVVNEYYNGMPNYKNGTIKLNQFNIDKKNVTTRNKKTYPKFGNYVFPHSLEEIEKMDPETEVDLNKFKAFVPIFSGDIKKRPKYW